MQAARSGCRPAARRLHGDRRTAGFTTQTCRTSSSHRPDRDARFHVEAGADVSENVAVSPKRRSSTSRDRRRHRATTAQIQDLPVAARRWIDMAMLTPGSSQDNIRGQFYRGNVNIGAGVTTFYSTGYVVDGVNNTWVEQGETRQNFPMDAIREFKVSTSSSRPNTGSRPAVVVNVVTKTGSNDLHFSGCSSSTKRRHDRAGQFFQPTKPAVLAALRMADRLAARSSRTRFTTSSRTSEPTRTCTTASARRRGRSTPEAIRASSIDGRTSDGPTRSSRQGQSVFVRVGQEDEYRPELTVGGDGDPELQLRFLRAPHVGRHRAHLGDQPARAERFPVSVRIREV